jgi:ubiquitin C-terminal hydrolase
MPGSGKTGLVNLGNTCFMNACIQCLASCHELDAVYRRPKTIETLDSGTSAEATVAKEWQKLRTLMWSDDCTVSPAGFLASIQRAAVSKGATLFTGFAQNDVGEFLRFLVSSCIHEATAAPVKMTVSGTGDSEQDELARCCYAAMTALYAKEYSPIVELFYGIGTSVVTGTGVRKTTAEPFFILSLPVPRYPCTIYDCFDDHAAACALRGSNQYETDDGVMVDATKEDGFWSFPSVLVIELKRFSNNLAKNNNMVEFPIETLSLAKYATGYQPAQYTYELFGVCNHSGRVCGGHYTAHARGTPNRWRHYDDRMVSDVPGRSVVTPKAYCLFYRKKS